LGQTTSLGEMRLEERAYEQPEVVVQEHVQLLDPASTIIGGTLSAKDYEILPVERDYRSLATILPQANQSYLGDPVNFAGATGSRTATSLMASTCQTPTREGRNEPPI